MPRNGSSTAAASSTPPSVEVHGSKAGMPRQSCAEAGERRRAGGPSAGSSSATVTAVAAKATTMASAAPAAMWVGRQPGAAPVLASAPSEHEHARARC